MEINSSLSLASHGSKSFILINSLDHKPGDIFRPSSILRSLQLGFWPNACLHYAAATNLWHPERPTGQLRSTTSIWNLLLQFCPLSPVVLASRGSTVGTVYLAVAANAVCSGSVNRVGPNSTGFEVYDRLSRCWKSNSSLRFLRSINKSLIVWYRSSGVFRSILPRIPSNSPL